MPLLICAAAAMQSQARGSAFSRRAVLTGAPAVLVGSHLAAAEEDFGGFAAQMQSEVNAAKQTPGEKKSASMQAQNQDPFAGSRAVDPDRQGRFADELPPMSRDERRQRAAAAKELSENTRAAPRVSKNELRRAGTTAAVTDEYTLIFDTAAGPLGLKLKDLRVGFEYGSTEGTSRILVSDITPGGQADKSDKVSIDDIVVAVYDGVPQRDSPAFAPSEA